jgi:phosphoribosylformylglycinamidine synthase
VLKPLVGVNDDGPGDSCIVRPLLNSMRGVVVSNGINPCYGDTDPYWMAASAIDEAIRQIVAVGAPVDRIALLDNFAWGNTARPDRLGALVRACQACYDIARVYETPFISGKDSLNNEYMVDGESICIPHTLLISALAVMPDVTKAVSMDAKAAGNLVYVVGLTRKELGGSHYYRVRGARGGSVPKVDPAAGLRLFKGLHVAMDGGLVRSCHDCSEGGIGVAAAEMAFAGGLGMDIDLRTAPQPAGESLRDDELIFSESNSRFIVEVLPSHREAFESALDGVPAAVVGRVNDSGMFRAFGAEGQVIVEAPIDRLKHVWQSTLAW